MFRLITLLYLPIILFQIATIHAAPGDEGGGWVGSGGDIHTNTNNPWFFKFQSYPTQNLIKYCIEMDEKNFSSDPETADILINLSFHAWRNEFQNWFTFMNRYYKDYASGFYPAVELATEQLIKLDCSSNDIDIAFQFGTLSNAQNMKLRSMEINPKEKVAIAVRTNYNEKTLRGKGFVYFSPDSGPMKVIGTEKLNIIWKHNYILLKVLEHEWGHIFGVSHQSKIDSIMHPNFPNFVTNEKMYKLLFEDLPEFINDQDIMDELKKTKLDIFATHDVRLTNCDPTTGENTDNIGRINKLRNFLEVNKVNAKCIFFDIRLDHIEVSIAKTYSGPYKTIGTIPMLPEEINNGATSFLTPAIGHGVKIVVGKQQIVFKDLNYSSYMWSVIEGPFPLTIEYKSIFENRVTKKPVVVRRTSGAGLEIIGSIMDSPEILFRSTTLDM